MGKQKIFIKGVVSVAGKDQVPLATLQTDPGHRCCDVVVPFVLGLMKFSRPVTLVLDAGKLTWGPWGALCVDS